MQNEIWICSICMGQREGLTIMMRNFLNGEWIAVMFDRRVGRFLADV
jgi:hypothetical protein